MCTLGGAGYRLYSHLLKKQWKPVKEVMESLRSVPPTSCFAVAILNVCHYSLPRREYTPRSLGRLELPVELIQMVFSHIENPLTAFRLGCANTRLLVIGEKRIHQLMGLPHWRGDRIMCVGDYCREDDLPEGLDLGDDYKEFCDDNDSKKTRPYDWACTFLKSSLEHWNSSEYSLSAGLDFDWFTRIRPDRVSSMMTNTISPTEKPSVLWNLSKQVYFRRESIPNDLPKAAERFDSDAVMGNILLLQIYWSSDPSIGLSYGRNSDDVKITRGKWAGDRFELTGKDVLESRLKEEDSKWKDVSEEVIKLFVDVWEAESW